MALPNGDLITTPFDPQMAYPSDRREQVDTLNSRDSIPMFIRWEGMGVYVLENSKKYILQGGRSNEYWKEIGTGTGTGGTTFVGQFESADLLPTSGRSAGDYAFVGTGDDFVQYNWDNIAGQWVMAEGQTDMASEFFHVGYKTPLRRPVIFPLLPKDVLVQTSGDFVFAPETAVARFIFTGEVIAIRGIQSAVSDREIKLVNRTGSDIILRDKSSGIPTGSGFDFGGSDYTWVNGSEITLKGNGTYWQLAPNNQVAFSDHLDSVNAQVNVGGDGLEVISGVNNLSTGISAEYKEVNEWVDGTEIDDTKVDGYIYVKIKGKYFIDSYFLLTGIINVARFGIIPNFKSSSDYTDYLTQINSVFEIANNLTEGSTRTGSSIKVIFPSSKHGLGYGVTGNVWASGTFDIEMNAPLIKVGSYNISDRSFLLVGNNTTIKPPFLNRKYNNRRLKLWARFDGNPKWDGTGNYSGIEVRSVVKSEVEIVESANFEVGVRFTGYNSAFAYNKLKLGNLWNNRIHVDCYSYSVLGDSAGFITSCSFDCFGRIGNDYLSGPLEFDRIGIRINGEGYTPESLTFFNGCIEGLIDSLTPEQYKGIPVLIERGNFNKFLDFRHEANFRAGDNPAFLHIYEGGSNFADLTIVVPRGTTVASELDDHLLLSDNSLRRQGNKVVSRRGKGRGFSTIENNIVFDSGLFSQKWTKYSSTRSHIIDFGSINSAGDIFRYIPRNAALGLENDIDSDGYLRLAVGSGIFIDIDTSEMKRFSRIIDHDINKAAKCAYYLYDENGVKIPWLEGGSRNLNGVLQSTEWTAYGSGGATDYGENENDLKSYGKKADISVTEKVKKVRIILYGIGSVETGRYSRVKSLRIVNIDGYGASKNISPYADGRRYATSPPSVGTYSDGDVVYYDHSIGADNITFWIAKSNGTNDVTIWKEFFTNRNYTPNASATPTLNIGHRRGYLDLTATTGSGNTTVPQSIFEEGDEVIGEVSGSAKTFVAGTGVTLRYPEGQGLTAPTGSRFIVKFKSPNDALVTIIKPYTTTAPNASTTQRGIIEQATDAETIAGTDTERAVSPAGLKALIDTITLNRLLDTPASKTGNKNKTVKVSNDETTHVYVADGVDVRNETSGGSISLALTDGFIASRLNFTSATAVTLQGLSSANGQSSLTLVNPHATNNLTIKHNGAGTVKYISPTATDFVIPPKTAARFEIVGNEIYPVISS